MFKTLKAKWSVLMMRLSFRIRQLRIRLAVRLAAPVDGFVASRAIYLRGTQGLADLMNKIEKSGILKGQPAKFGAIERMVELVTQDFVDAMKVGEPALQMEAIRDVYVQARLRGMTKKQRAQIEHMQALRNLTQRGEAVRQIPPTPVGAPEQAPPAAVEVAEAPRA